MLHQVVCSSHITSSKKPQIVRFEAFYFLPIPYSLFPLHYSLYLFTLHFSLFALHSPNPHCCVIRNLPFGQCCIRSCVRVTFPSSKKPLSYLNSRAFYLLSFYYFSNLRISLYQLNYITLVFPQRCVNAVCGGLKHVVEQEAVYLSGGAKPEKRTCRAVRLMSVDIP